MKKKTIIILAAAVAVIALALGAVVGYNMWYNNTHIFVEDAVYEKDARFLDLRGTGISVEHYETVKEQLPLCDITWEVPFQGGFVPADETALSISSLTDADVALLDYLTNLQKVDASSCTDYEQLMALKERHPGCEITYQVTLNGEEYPHDVKKLSFDDVDGEALAAALPYLPELQSVAIDMPTMPAATLLGLVERYPEVSFSWNASVLGQTYPHDITELNFSNTPLEGVEELEAALAYLPGLELLDLSYCGIESETLAAYRERQKDHYKVVWTVNLGWNINVRTDATTFMPVMMNNGEGKVWDSTLTDLKYCNEMICVDVGHMPISHCDWAAYMPNLKYLIVADTGITSIEGVRGLQHLIYLECFTTPVTDYSPLLEVPNLKDLNIVNSGADPEIIAQLTSLERLWWGGFYRVSLSDEDRQMIREALPNTDCQLNVLNPTAMGWRKGKLYYEMRDVLGMPYFGQ